MNILFVTLYPIRVNTSVMISNYGLIYGFIKEGHDVTVVAPSASVLYENQLPFDSGTLNFIEFGETAPERNENINKNRGTLSRKLRLTLKTIYEAINLFDRSSRFFKYVDKIDIYNRKYDIVVSTSDPKNSHRFVRKMISHGLIYDRWIQHWGDPMCGDISRKTIYPKFVIKRVEEKVMESADKIVYVSPFTLDEQKRIHPRLSNKMTFVPLPCDFTKKEAPRKNVKDAPLIVSYFGDYSSAVRNILPLYNACSRMKNVILYIAGNSNITIENKDNIRVYPRLPKNELAEIEEKTDLIVSVGNLSGTQIPGKIYYESSSAKAILVTVDGNGCGKVKDYLNTFNRFILCDNTEESIYESIQLFAQRQRVEFTTPERLLPHNIAKEVLK